MVRERKAFKPKGLLRKLGLTVADVERVYHQLALVGRARDPLKDWYLVVRAAPHRAHEKFEGDARNAHLIYDAAQVLRRFITDLTGMVPPDCDAVFGYPQDYTERWLGHERRLYYDRADFKRILDRHRLTPHGVHVFVEGDSDEVLLAGLIDAIWGDHRSVGVRFTALGGVGNAGNLRGKTLFEAFSTYARKAILVADDEGKILRDVERLRGAGFLLEEDEFHGWKRNIEEDSASLGELISFARQLAKPQRKQLRLTVAELKKIMAANGGKKGAAQHIIDYAKETSEIRITKRGIARLLRDRIIAELEDLDEDGVMALAEHRKVLGLAIAIGRYSGHR